MSLTLVKPTCVWLWTRMLIDCVCEGIYVCTSMCFLIKVMFYQEDSICNQLDSGTRFLDLRIAHKSKDPDKVFYFAHGIYSLVTVKVSLKLKSLPLRRCRPRKINVKKNKYVQENIDITLTKVCCQSSKKLGQVSVRFVFLVQGWSKNNPKEC